MKKDIYAVWLVVVMLFALVIVAHADEINYDSPFTAQLNKPIICGDNVQVKQHYLDLGYTPVIRSTSAIKFKTIVYLKELTPKSGKITDIVILEINPGETIACVTFAGKEVQFNTNFWDEFNATIIYLDPEKGEPI